MAEEKFDKYAYDQQYIKSHVKLKQISFNTSKPEDVRMMQWLESQPEGITRYIKRLIAQDMNKPKGAWTIR